MENQVVKDPRSWRFVWFHKKDNHESIIEGKKVWLNEKRRAMLYVKQCQEDKYFPFDIKKFYIGDSMEDGSLMLTLEGVNHKGDGNLKIK